MLPATRQDVQTWHGPVCLLPRWFLQCRRGKDNKTADHQKKNNMEPNKNVRNKWLTVRMTAKEYEELDRLWKKTTCGQMSEYVRKVALRKPVYVKFRNLSADSLLTEIVAFRKEFKAVGVNFNQVVHKLHTLDHIPEFLAWVLVNERHKDLLFTTMKQIQDRLNEIYKLWLSDSQSRGKTSAM